MKRLLRNSRAFLFLVVVALVGTIGTIGIVYADQTNESVHRVCVDQRGNMRLLGSDINGNFSDECKQNEFMIELPSRQLTTEIESLLSEQGNIISGLENTVNEQGNIISGLESTNNAQESAIGDLESRVTALEAGNSGGGNSGGGGSGGIVTGSLVLWLPMDEGQGTVAYDNSGLGNDGVITGATWTQLPNGLWYLSFDGQSAKIVVPDHASLSISNAITIEAWIKPGVAFTGTTYQILDKRNGGIAPTLLWHNTRNLVIYAGDYAAQGATTSLSADTWYHVVGTLIDGTANGKVFINGADDTTSTATATFVTNTAPLVIGATTTLANWFNGVIGEVRIYARALTPLEIEQNYLATSGRYS